MSITKTREFFSLPNVHYAEEDYKQSGQTEETVWPDFVIGAYWAYLANKGN